MRISDWSSDVCSSDLRCRVDACATGGQRCAPALATEVAAVPGGLDREAFSGCSGELYQSTTCAHSKRTQDDPYCQWVPPSSRLTGWPSNATTSRSDRQSDV